MRRLVAISNKTSKTIMVAVALPIALTSIHLAATARVSSLRREQEKLEQTRLSAQPSAIIAPLSQPFQSPMQNQESRDSAKQPVMYPAANQSGANVTAATGTAAAHKRQIVISILDRKLAVLEEGQVLKVYPIAVGTRGTPSPDGDFVIVNHAKDPVYRHRNKEIAPGKDNPLGSRWMGLNRKGYGIHGTNMQSSVGKAASHGCFRLRKQDVEELYTLMQVGDAVTVHRERDETVAKVFAETSVAPATLASKTQSGGDVQMASATVTTVESTEQ